jgi:hypothetical protein
MIDSTWTYQYNLVQKMPDLATVNLADSYQQLARQSQGKAGKKAHPGYQQSRSQTVRYSLSTTDYATASSRCWPPPVQRPTLPSRTMQKNIASQNTFPSSSQARYCWSKKTPYRRAPAQNYSSEFLLRGIRSICNLM